MERIGTGTPCIRVCRIDSQSKLCSGCFRTLDEIMNWMQFSESERAEVLQKIEQRKGAK